MKRQKRRIESRLAVLEDVMLADARTEAECERQAGDIVHALEIIDATDGDGRVAVYDRIEILTRLRVSKGLAA